MNEVAKTTEEKINEKTDLTIAGQTEISASVGGITFKDMSQVMEFSKLMSLSKQAVPPHLRTQPGMCLAVSLQALNWRMDPFAVANKSYSVNDRIAYEAQLIQAVIEQRAPIKGRIKGDFEGEGDKRVCVMRVVSSEDGEEITYRSPPIGSIKVKNSPLWRTDPDQQLWYYSARAMCRRHFPDVLMGVYEKDEIASGQIKDVTPAEPEHKNLAQKLSEQSEEPIDGEIVTVDEGSLEYAEGMTAAKDGKKRGACPHMNDPQMMADWMAGFDSVEHE